MSHNGTTFDFIFFRRLLSELKKNISDIPIVFIDSLLLSRRLVPGRFSYKQISLCKYFHIEVESAHRALSDVIYLQQLYQELIDLYKSSTKDLLVDPILLTKYILFNE